VRYFFEKGAVGEEGQLLVDPMIALNKVGHALHVEHPTFNAITFSNRVREICWQLNYNKPAVCQSMYIYKNPGVGGEDSWFLHTDPNSAVGFWMALEDCTLQNGCLQFIKGSHKSGVHRRYLRNPDKDASELMVYDRAAPIYPQSSFTPMQVSKGTCILIHGNVVHKSEPNRSQKSRHAYTFHVIETENNVKYSEDNWLQAPKDKPFPPCLAFLRGQAEQLDLPMAVYYPANDQNPVAILTWEGLEPELPSILLNSHMDVVPVFPENWTHPPFGAEIDEEGHEEMGGRFGMRPFVTTDEFVALNVGFGMDEGLASPGEDIPLFYAERGTAGHGSLLLAHTAGEKLNYIVGKMMELRKVQVQRLQNNPELVIGDVTTINLTKVSGGVQSNVVPPLLMVAFDCRLALDLNKWCDDVGGGIEITYEQKQPKVPPTAIDDSNPFWLAFKEATEELKLSIKPQIFTGGTDSRYIRQVGIPALGFSPMNNTPVLLHDHDEFIRADTYLRGVEIFQKIISNIKEPCVEFLKRQAKDLDLRIKIYYPLNEQNPVAVLTWEGLEKELPSILLNSHMDVVPVFPENWTHSPFAAEIDEDGHEELGGRKGMFPFVTSEDFKSLNTGFSLDEGIASPTSEFPVFYAERTVKRVILKISGSAGHGLLLMPNTAGEKLSYITAKMMQFRAGQVKRLKDNPELQIGDVTTINLTTVDGGVQSNVVPPLLTVCFDLAKWCEEAGGDIELEFSSIWRKGHIPPTVTDETNPFWVAFKSATDELGLLTKLQVFPGGTDSRYIRHVGVPALGFSPMNNTPVLLHDNDEFLHADISERCGDIPENYRQFSQCLSF
ncbi:hypothetical protein M5D96_000011, partial [Drosophila gunungcola]